MRGRVFQALVRHAGWPPAAGAIERIRNLTTYAMGAGTASLHVEESGEGALLRRLAGHWRGREVTVLDVGAHTGEYALSARTAFGPDAVLHCFEPHPETFATLTARVGMDPLTTCHRLALGDAPGSASLFSEAACSPFTSLHPDTFSLAGREVTRVDEVRVRTLEEVVGELGLARIDLLKVDVEGHELAVLRGAGGLLKGRPIGAVQFEFGERNLASRSFLRDFFQFLGPEFAFFRVTPFGLRRLEYSPAAEIFVLEANYLAARGELRGLLVG